MGGGLYCMTLRAYLRVFRAARHKRRHIAVEALELPRRSRLHEHHLLLRPRLCRLAGFHACGIVLGTYSHVLEHMLGTQRLWLAVLPTQGACAA